MTIFQHLKEDGTVITYETRTEPGKKCESCQGLWGTTYHPAERPCAMVVKED